MKIATIIARNLPGLIFVVFGANMFLRFIPMPPPPKGLARDFMTAVARWN
jgi:putative oxidoreductase